jgi:uncharacterized protein
MTRTRISLIFLMSALIWGCSTQIPVISQPNNNAPSTNRAQTLPIGARAKMGRVTIDLEVAKTAQQQEMGLMYRSSLAKNRGMLFEFKELRYSRFWMKNTIIPLDIIFLNNDKIEAIFANVPPCTKDPCPSYGPSTKINRVIELAGGRAKELGLNAGDRININFVKPPQN